MPIDRVDQVQRHLEEPIGNHADNLLFHAGAVFKQKKQDERDNDGQREQREKIDQEGCDIRQGQGGLFTDRAAQFPDGHLNRTPCCQLVGFVYEVPDRVVRMVRFQSQLSGQRRICFPVVDRSVDDKCSQ